MSVALTAAVIGAGDMGSRHARHWAAVGARVLAVVDPDTSRVAAAAAETGAVALASFAEALALRPDVVSVCTPTFLHAPITIAAFQAGAHVLCEKPVALTLADGRAMADAALAAGKELRIGFMRRFDPAAARLAETVARAGTPLLVQATITAGIRPKRLMHDATANGGPVIDMACHVFDLWSRMFGGPAEQVVAIGHTFGDGRPELANIRQRALDSAAATLRYPGGHLAQLQISWGLPSGIAPREQHTYVGPHGLVTVEWPGAVDWHDGGPATPWHHPGDDPYRAQIAQFHAELTHAAPREVATIDDGMSALATSLAVLASIDQGHAVRPAALLAAGAATRAGGGADA